MPGVSEHRIKRGRAILRKGAIPQIFSDLTLKKTNDLAKEVILKYQEGTFIESNKQFLLLKGEEVDFKEMLNFFDKIPLPTKNWFVNSVEKFIQWSSFGYNFNNCSKIVRINYDKTINVLLDGKEVKIPNFDTFNNVNDVVALLNEVEKIILCGESNRQMCRICYAKRH
ncbi:uncharacterized protein LOC127282247 isoform X3 [Leptopilina boulardi]|uniref:uncharacterized protein LOC127282247 isoform X3 n=1 Tax=Leptopilina boulardi TaxID=63433 RepID=UPI0021F52F96|nr:uncharacterized protein LOC127282247 isoform X3 [Leptopilina boulardi]